MLTLCPQCRAPSNLRQTSCWVCKRAFDGSEPRIGAVPFARQPLPYHQRVTATVTQLAAETDGLEQDEWGRLHVRVHRAHSAG
jgi:hypothetical protein